MSFTNSAVRKGLPDCGGSSRTPTLHLNRPARRGCGWWSPIGYSVVSQFPVQAEGHKHRIDLLLQGTHVGLEFDGLIKYGSDLEDPDPEQIARVVRDEKRRHARIEGRGYRLLRIIWEQLSDPTTLDRRIRHALGQGAARRSVPPTPPW